MLSDYWLTPDIRRLLPEMPPLSSPERRHLQRLLSEILDDSRYQGWRNEVTKAQEVEPLKTSIWDKIIRHDLSLVAEKLEPYSLKIESSNDKYHYIEFRDLIIRISTIENIINECKIKFKKGASLQGVYTSLKDFKSILDKINLPGWYTDIEICERVNRRNCAK